MIKPHIFWTGVQWCCFSKVSEGSILRYVAFGPTPAAAYEQHEEKRRSCGQVIAGAAF